MCIYSPAGGIIRKAKDGLAAKLQVTTEYYDGQVALLHHSLKNYPGMQNQSNDQQHIVKSNQFNY